MSITETFTTLFLVPGLGFDVEEIRSPHGFLNGYLKDADALGSYEYSIYMLFRPHDIGKFEEFVMQEYARTRDLLEDYDYASGFVVLVYQFPHQYRPEYNMFLKGRYSKFRKMYIRMLPPIKILPDGSAEPGVTLTIPYMACTKARALKQYWEERLNVPGESDIVLDSEDEFWPKPRMERETLAISRIKTKLNID